MTSVLVAIDEPRASTLSADLERDGVRIIAIVRPEDVTAALLVETDAVILPATRSALTSDLVEACDRSGRPHRRARCGRLAAAQPLRAARSTS